MPSGIVQAVGKSRSGKPTVTIDGQIYSAGKVDAPHVGDRIEFDSASSIYNGATIWFLNSWKLLEAAPKYAASRPTDNGIAAPTQQAQGGITEGERAAISNSLPALITSGLVKDGVDAGLWAKRIVQAIRHAGDREAGED